MATSSPGAMDQPAAVLVQLGPHGPALVPSRSPFLRADDLGVLRGDGVFERFIVNASQPRHLEDHLARLAHSAASIDLVLPSRDAWKQAVAAGYRNAAIRTESAFDSLRARSDFQALMFDVGFPINPFNVVP